MADFPFTLEGLVSDTNSLAKSDAKVIAFDKMITTTAENVASVLPKLPQENEFLAIWTIKSFNTFSFIAHFAKFGAIDELIITTYNMSRRVILLLMQMVDDGKIKYVSIFLSDAAKSLFPASYNMLVEEASKRVDKVFVSWGWNHSKVALISQGNDRFVIEGSGNFSENAKHEQYILFNNTILFEFRKHWILENFTHG